MSWYGKMNKVFGDFCGALSLIIASYISAFVLQLIGLSALISSLIIDISLGTVAFLLYRKMRSQPKFRLQRCVNKKASIITGICFIPLVYYIVNLSLWCSNVLFINDAGMAKHTSNLQSGSFVLQMIFVVVIAPLYEELSLRLFAYNWLKSSINWVSSMIITALVFAAMHGTKSHLVSGFIFGIIMVLVYEITGLWWASIVAHMFYNLMAMILPSGIFIHSTSVILLLTLFVICGIVFVSVYVDKLMKSDKYVKNDV